MSAEHQRYGHCRPATRFGASGHVSWCSVCRPYAEAIAHLLDPTGSLFGDRIIAKETVDDFTTMNTEKRLMQVCLPAAACCPAGVLLHAVPL